MREVTITKTCVEHTLYAVVGDTRTQLVHFCIPRYKEGIDLSVLAWYIKAVNAVGATDIYNINSPATYDDNYVRIDWLVKGVATAAVGETQYEIQGVATDASGNEMVWQSFIGTLVVSDELQATPSEEEEQQMSALQELIVYVQNELPTVLAARDTANTAAQSADNAAVAANNAAENANEVASELQQKAEDGEFDGNGIESAILNSNYTLTLEFTDGTSYTTPSIRGAQGEKGDTGDTGEQGPQGLPGDNGVTPVFSIGNVSTLPEGASASASITGTMENPVLNLGIPKGDTGAQGIQGEQGIQGVQGEPGHDGVTPDFSIGNVSTLPAGSSASASITGTTANPVLNLGIPQGVQGVQGETGETGASGPKGDPGEGVPAGGAEGDVLTKSSAADYATEWTAPAVTAAQFAALQAQMDALYPTKSVGPAAAVAVDDALAGNAQGLTVAIEPVQDLHGYDHPWPAGGGKNKFDPSVLLIQSNFYNVNTDGSITVLGSNTSAWDDLPALELPAGTYTASRNNNFGNTSIRDITDNVAIGFMGDGGANSTTFAVAEGHTVKIRLASAASQYPITQKIQIESGSTATLWSPYSNICPITGWTRAKVTRMGKNLLDTSNIQMASWNKWDIPNKLKPNTTYTFSVFDATYSYGLFMSVNHTATGDGSTIRLAGYIQNTHYTFTTPSDTEDYPWLILGGSANGAGRAYANFQLELGSTATDYEPYAGHTYDITFPSAAGTVYGGDLDVTSGVLDVTMASVDMGTLNYSIASGALSPSGYVFRTQTAIAKPRVRYDENHVLSPIYHSSTNYWYTGDPDNYGMFVNNEGRVIFRNDEYGSDASAFKTAMSGVQFVYELATPITYQLTPQQIALLRGNNTVWSDTGDVTLTYKQDVALLLEKLQS